MSTPALDNNWMDWALKAAGAIILFLLSLGVKDIRDRVRKSEELCTQVDALYNLSQEKFRLLEERIKVIEERIRSIEDRIRVIEDRLTRIQVVVDAK